MIAHFGWRAAPVPKHRRDHNHNNQLNPKVCRLLTSPRPGTDGAATKNSRRRAIS